MGSGFGAEGIPAEPQNNPNTSWFRVNVPVFGRPGHGSFRETQAQTGASVFLPSPRPKQRTEILDLFGVV